MRHVRKAHEAESERTELAIHEESPMRSVGAFETRQKRLFDTYPHCQMLLKGVVMGHRIAPSLLAAALASLALVAVPPVAGQTAGSTTATPPGKSATTSGTTAT